MLSVEQIDRQWVQTLPIDEQVQLMSKILQRLNHTVGVTSIAHDRDAAEPHSIMELHGLGAELWAGIDAQTYVDRLRNEWERPFP